MSIVTYRIKNGQTEVMANRRSEVPISNVYDQVGDYVNLKVEKVVDNDAYKGDEEFEFTVAKAAVEYDEYGNDTRVDVMPDDGTDVIKVKAGEVGEFGAIGYPEGSGAGTYYYTITETVPDDEHKTKGMTYATDPVWVRVDVPETPAGETAKECDVWYGTSKEDVDAQADSGAAPAGADGHATITNSYRVGSLRVVKSLTGVPRQYRDKEFTITVTNEEGKYLDENGSLNDAETTMTVTAKEPLVVTDVPLGTYTVTELEEDREVEGSDVDEEASTTTATIEVTGDDDAKKPAELKIENVYHVHDNDGQLKVTKRVTGDKYEGKDSFTFRLTKYGEDEETGEDEEPTDDEDYTEDEEPADDETADDEEPGDDESGDDETGDQDETTDDEVAEDETDDVTTDEVDALADNAEDEETDGEEAAAENNVLPEKDTVTIKAGETGKFGTITYTEEGEYYYAINEVVPDASERAEGMTYDTNTYLALVSVDADLNVYGPVYARFTGDEDETFEALYEALDSSGGAAAELTVTNTYKKGSTAAALKATKKLEGRALKAGEFGFQLRDADGKVLQTKTNLVNGQVNFDEITYAATDAGKTFNYTIAEVKGNVANVTYDTHVAKAAVRVAEGKDGKLAATVTYDSGATNTFVNTYTPPTTPPTTPKNSTPTTPTTRTVTTAKTGDPTSLAAVAALAVTGAASVIAGRRRRRRA